MRWALVFACACRFEPGAFPIVGDADPPSDLRPIDTPSSDAPTRDESACPSAPFGCQLFTCAGSSSCYYFCGVETGTKATWGGAVGTCSNAQLGCIVTISDQAEQDCITARTQPSFPSALVWFGYRQDQPSNDEPAGGWGWECPSSSYVQPGWGTTSSEPNDQGNNEDCGSLSNNGIWIDAACDGTARYVCELP